MIYLYCDILGAAGGIESYLHALALRLHQDRIPFRIAATEASHCPLLDELVQRGIRVYRQRRVPGDTWRISQRLMNLWLFAQLRRGDWVYCVRQPMFPLYPSLIRWVHRRGARLAASWMLSPEYLPAVGPGKHRILRAIRNTDAMISVSKCALSQFHSVYGCTGPIHMVRYHHVLLFREPMELPQGPPWRVAFIGRLAIGHKNLDTLFRAFSRVHKRNPDCLLDLHGGGPDLDNLQAFAAQLGITNAVAFHGPYDHRRDLPRIMASAHFFVYPSRFEGGPCMSLLEILQAGRFCVASSVGGIPDIYGGHPDIGALVDPDDEQGLADAIEDALQRVKTGGVDGRAIRARYDEEFTAEIAHSQWLKALNLT